MTRNTTTTTTTTSGQDVPAPPMLDLVPLSHLALDRPEPVGGWVELLDREGIVLTEDDIGRAAIRREDARHLLGVYRAEEAYRDDERRRRQVEQERRQAEWAARHRPARGVPAVAGLSPVEQMLAAGESDRPKSVFADLLDTELAHVQRGQ